MQPEEGTTYIWIDVDAYGAAVDDLDATLTGLAEHISRLEADFGFLGVDKSNLNKLLEARSDLEDIMPDMRRRHSLAVQMLAEKQLGGWAGDGVLYLDGVDILNDLFGSVEEAQEAGSELADQVNDSDGEIPPEVYEQLEQYGSDPDFAEAFVDSLDPAASGFLLQDAYVQATEVGNESPQLALATVFSTASFRIDYGVDFIGEINQAMLDAGVAQNGISVVDWMAALIQHGDWDDGSLVAFTEAAFFGEQETIGTVTAWAEIYTGLARNPLASAEFMAAHPDEVWDDLQAIGPVASDDAYQAALAAFLEAATVDARVVFTRLGTPNLAEQNAAFVIEHVGSLDAPFPFSDAMSVAFASITTEYWDDFLYSFSSPAGVADNPGRAGIEVDPSNWEAFLLEAMRSEEGAARVYDLFASQLPEDRGDRVGLFDEEDTDTAHLTGWSGHMVGSLGNLFVSLWDQVVAAREAEGQARDEFLDSVIEFLWDPKSVVEGAADDVKKKAKDNFKSTVKGLIKSWLDSLTDQEIQQLDTDLFGDRQAWMDYANAFNDQGRLPLDPGYDDGNVTWDGDPSSYEDLYGGSFRDSSGAILPLEQIREDPAALQAYNAWLQDPAVQMITDPLFQSEGHP